jgi:hypothetical protein
MLRHFCDAVEKKITNPRWLAVGLAKAEAFLTAYPGRRISILRLREGRFVSGALYGGAPEAYIGALETLAYFRHSRKNQFAMARKFGFRSLARLYLGRVTLEEAERKAGSMFGSQGIVVPDCHPAACLDFDNGGDYSILQSLMKH